MHTQICIAFQLHRGAVVILKSVTASRILENLEATEVDLDEEDMIKLKELDKGCRYLRFFMLRKGEWMLHCGMNSGKILQERWKYFCVQWTI